MSERVRWDVNVSKELDRAVEHIADEAGATRADVVRQAIALIKVAHAAKK